MGQHHHLRGGGLVDDTAFVNDSVYVNKTATVGARSYVGHGAYINAGVIVGTDCIICDRVRVTANVANGTTVLCDCCEGGGGGGSADMVLASTVLAFDGFVSAALRSFVAAPGTADWEINVGTPPRGVIPLNSFTGLATVAVRVQLSLWMHDQAWANVSAGNMTYSVFRDDGTLLGSGVFPCDGVTVGKVLLVDVTLAIGTINAGNGVYVTWAIPADESTPGDGNLYQRLNLVVSASPPP